MTIRNIRQRWPAAEKALETEGEITITRDGKPVARLVRVAERPRYRKRWDPKEHLTWLKKSWGSKLFPSIDPALASDRADQWQTGRK